MRTSPRRNSLCGTSRLAGFGLVDTLVGLFLLVITSVVLYNGFSSLMTLSQRQESKAEALVKTIDAKNYAPWL